MRLPPDWRTRDVLDLPVAAIDVETTGLDPDRDWPIEIAVVTAPSLRQAWRSTVVTQLLIRPPVPVSREAQAIHGISDERLSVAGRDPRMVARQVRSWIDGRLLVGHWLAFDLVMLRKALDPAIELMVETPVDTLALARRVAPSSSHRLVDVAERCDVALLRPHRAADDAKAALGVARRVILALRAAGEEAITAADCWRIACAEGPLADAKRGGAYWTRLLAMHREGASAAGGEDAVRA